MALIPASPNTRFYPCSPSIPTRQTRLHFINTCCRAFSSSCIWKQNFSTISIPKGSKDGKRRHVLTCLQASAGENRGRILLSDVVVKRRPTIYSGRKWNFLDMATATVVLIMHISCLFAPFTFTWPAFWVAVVLYVVTGLFGITLSFHRNLSHRSFKLPKWLEYFFAYCGVQAMQGNPMDWVSTHRYHHQFCDSDRDPHSPIEGFWFSHISWLFDTNSIVKKAVRTVWVYHITWFVNSACHVWGRQAWNTGDLSRNNWWVALLAFGEGWHNNHHAFEFSARHGLEWWQLDMTWYVVWLLQAIGLATDVKLPSDIQKQRMSLASGTTAL